MSTKAISNFQGQKENRRRLKKMWTLTLSIWSKSQYGCNSIEDKEDYNILAKMLVRCYGFSAFIVELS